MCSSRSRHSDRCAPRLLGASAWISSTITVCVVASVLRPDSLVSRMYSDSGVVTRICGGLRRIRSRSACGVSPVRTSVRISTSGKPSAAELLTDAAQRLVEILLDVVGQRFERRDIDDLDLVAQLMAHALAHQPSIAARNAASVLPDPVGAAINTCCPDWIAGHARICGSVGAL